MLDQTSKIWVKGKGNHLGSNIKQTNKQMHISRIKLCKHTSKSKTNKSQISHFHFTKPRQMKVNYCTLYYNISIVENSQDYYVTYKYDYQMSFNNIKCTSEVHILYVKITLWKRIRATCENLGYWHMWQFCHCHDSFPEYSKKRHNANRKVTTQAFLAEHSSFSVIF